MMRDEKKQKISGLIIPLISAIGGLLLGVALQRSWDGPQGQFKKSVSLEGMIRSGDEAFRSGDYAQAMSLYNRADRMLSASLDFENESPSKDVEVLQHYHNTKALLRIRRELSLIAEDVRDLRTTTPP